MTDISAAIGLAQMKHIEDFTRKRIENASFLSGEISRIKGLVPPTVAPGVKHVFHQFTIRVTKEYGMTRDELKNKLQKQGIGSGVYYPIPIHKQPLFKNMGYKDSLPNTEAAAGEVLSLPVFPGLTQEDLETIVSALQQ
jgi:dTDP-4-amino-4,6-dideoxygalactose transaminase